MAQSLVFGSFTLCDPTAYGTKNGYFLDYAASVIPSWNIQEIVLPFTEYRIPRIVGYGQSSSTTKVLVFEGITFFTNETGKDNWIKQALNYSQDPYRNLSTLYYGDPDLSTTQQTETNMMMRVQIKDRYSWGNAMSDGYTQYLMWTASFEKWSAT